MGTTRSQFGSACEAFVSFSLDILKEFRGLINKIKLRTLESRNLVSFFIFAY